MRKCMLLIIYNNVSFHILPVRVQSSPLTIYLYVSSTAKDILVSTVMS